MNSPRPVASISSTRVSPIHSHPAAAVYAQLDSSPQGLTRAEVNRRLQRYGRNTIRTLKAQSLIRKFLANFTHLMALLLWVGGIIGFIAGMPELGIAIWTVNLINGVFSFWQEYQAEKATEALRRLLPRYARVLRDGLEQQVFAEELVPGDFLLLAEGDHISADGRLVQDAELRIDQSTLTGESHSVRSTASAVLRTERVSVFHLELFRNRLIWIGIALELVLVFAIVYLPPLQRVFGTAAFPLHYWLYLFALTPLLLIAEEIRKKAVRRQGNKAVGVRP